MVEYHPALLVSPSQYHSTNTPYSLHFNTCFQKNKREKYENLQMKYIGEHWKEKHFHISCLSPLRDEEGIRLPISNDFL